MVDVAWQFLWRDLAFGVACGKIRNRVYGRQKPSADMSEIRTKWLSKVLLLLFLTKPPPREARIILEPVMLVEVNCGLVTI